jgi:hypothetical protein
MNKPITQLAFCFLIILLNAELFSQKDAEVAKPNHTFNFYFINGYAISYNFLETGSFFLRAQLDLSTNKQDIDLEGERITNYTTSEYKYSTSGNTDNDYFSVGASAHIVFPLYTNKYGRFYFGTGPIFTYTTMNYNFSETYTQYYPDTTAVQYTQTNTNTNNVKNYDVGALVYIGLQGILTENISIFVEAHFKGGKRWNESDWESTSTNNVSNSIKTTSTSSGDGWFYEAQFIRLGVSISL